jgi:hypothetical protein
VPREGDAPVISMTDTVTFAVSVPTFALTVAVPVAIAVTTPSFLPTVATAGFDDDHSTRTASGRSLAS